MLNRIRKMLKQQEGFTLVELMIVVVILGIISGIGIQQYGKVQERARDAADDANKRIITSAAQMYIMMENVADDELNSVTMANLISAGYLDDYPDDPNNKDKTYEVVVTKAGDKYTFTVTGSKPKPEEGTGGL